MPSSLRQSQHGRVVTLISQMDVYLQLKLAWVIVVLAVFASHGVNWNQERLCGMDRRGGIVDEVQRWWRGSYT